MKLAAVIYRFACAVVALSVLVAPTRSLGQSYSPMYPPRSTSSHYWVYCYSIDGGQVVYNCPVGITTQFYVSTNAHFHGGSGQPRSSIFCWNSSQNSCSPSNGLNIDANTSTLGSVEIYLYTPLIGQAERLKAWPSSNPLNAAYKDYAVGYNDLFYNDHPEIWMRTGGSENIPSGDTGHGTTYYNRYMTWTAANGLYGATLDYPPLQQQGKVCTNDMALPFGGKFDISTFSRWFSPHIEHDRGTAADVAGPTSAQCPDSYEVNIADFITRCVARGASDIYSISEGNHAHCNWANPATYPH